MKKLALFDFDGVLIDTLGVAYQINTKVNDNLSLEEYVSFFKGNIHSAIRHDGTPKKYHPEFFDLYDHMTRELIVPDILKEVLKKLSEKCILVIVSSTHTNSIKKILDREKLSDLFKDILGSDFHKSKIKKIKTILEKYKITPEESVFITDTVGDIKEARECGVESVAVTWGYHTESTLQKANPILTLSNPIDLLSIISEK